MKPKSKFLLAATCLGALIASPASAAEVITTLSFSGATLTNGGTASGSFTYRYDSVTNLLTGVDSALLTTTAGSGVNAFPAFTWAYNVPGLTTNTNPIGVSDAADGSHQFGLVDSQTYFDSLVGAYVPFQGLGTQASLIVQSSNFASFFYCQGAHGCNSTGLQSAGTSVAVLGAGAATSAVPEPGTWALMLAGLGVLGFALRRRAQPAMTVSYA